MLNETTRTLRMTVSVGRLTLRRDGPVERRARTVESAAVLAAFALLGTSLLMWLPLIGTGLGIDPDLRLAFTLSALSGAWPLLRVGFSGVRQETVIDAASGEMRQYRLTAGGNIRLCRTVPLPMVESVFVRRCPAGRCSKLIARLIGGEEIDIGTAAVQHLERLHLEIVAALRHTTTAPAEPVTPKRRLPRRPAALRGQGRMSA